MLAGAFAGAVLGVCLAWLVILLVAPAMVIDAAMAVVLVTGVVGAGGGFLVVRRPGRTIG